MVPWERACSQFRWVNGRALRVIASKLAPTQTGRHGGCSSLNQCRKRGGISGRTGRSVLLQSTAGLGLDLAPEGGGFFGDDLFRVDDFGGASG